MLKSWDLETDVLVIGYGLAGGVAAVVAHDAGADTLILEKSDHPGGISLLAGGTLRCARDLEQAVQYLSAISGGRMEAEIIRTFAAALVQNEAFLRELAAVDGSEVATRDLPGIYPYPGTETFYSVSVANIPGFTKFPWMLQPSRHPGGVNLVKMIMDNVESRGIKVKMSTPARRLETDDQGAIVGAIAVSDGREIAVRARKAVILATGGFEQNEWLRKQYLVGAPVYSMAPLTHTGDGVTMAQKVGAALWHMWLFHGSYGFKTPDSPIAYRNSLGGPRFFIHRTVPWIVVDKLGSRYMNEYPPAVQDTGHRPMELFDPDLPGLPRVPSYMIFDEAGRVAGPISSPPQIPGYEYEWSKDNSKEIAKGWIVQADSIPKLAATIKERFPENLNLMDSARLEATVKEWNRCVDSGRDPFNRTVKSMMAITKPPFYAAEVWPLLSNTQGGPVHNARQQVMDSFGHPIPRLYAVGELGSFFGHVYDLGGNLAECLTSGRIAGKNGAAEPSLP